MADTTTLTLANYSKAIPRSYTDLPMIKMEETPFEMKGTNSYGMICYAKDSGKWLMVQRRHSIGLICLIKSFYKCVDIPEHVREMTEVERDGILRSLSSYEEFYNLVNETLVRGASGGSAKKESYTSAAWTRLVENKDIILRSLEKYKDVKSELAWDWPKGQQERLASGLEDPKNTAMRELIEETGIGVIKDAYTISEEFMTQSFITNMGYRYTSYFWVCILPNTIPLPEVAPKNKEVNNCSWLTTKEVEEKLSGMSLKIFSHAKRIVSTT